MVWSSIMSFSISWAVHTVWMEIRCPGVIPFHLSLADCLISIMLNLLVSTARFTPEVHLIHALRWPQGCPTIRSRCQALHLGQVHLFYLGTVGSKRCGTSSFRSSWFRGEPEEAKRKRSWASYLHHPGSYPHSSACSCADSSGCCRDDQCHLLIAPPLSTACLELVFNQELRHLPRVMGFPRWDSPWARTGELCHPQPP